jgi:hypothetical protein
MRAKCPKQGFLDQARDQDRIRLDLNLGIACFVALTAAWLYFTYAARRAMRT